MWGEGLANKLGRLANGIGTRMLTSTCTIKFIEMSQVPRDRKVTYGNMVRDIRPHKEETHRVRMAVGGDHIDYPGEVSIPISDLASAKYLINIIMSIRKAKGLCADVKIFYLNTEMERYGI